MRVIIGLGSSEPTAAIASALERSFPEATFSFPHSLMQIPNPREWRVFAVAFGFFSFC
jgi:hypothetical protein